MKKYVSALALAALVGAPAAQALTTTIGGEYEANGYTIDRGDATPLRVITPATGFTLNPTTGLIDPPTAAVTEEGDDEAAFQQLLRLSVHNKLDSGVQVNTRFNLSNSTWQGDGATSAAAADAVGHNQYATGDFSRRANETVTLDYGYVVVPLGGSTSLTVGRVTSNWPACFLVCDDRRDRLIITTKIGAHTILPIYTHKAEGLTNNDADDLSDTQVVALGPLGGGWSYFGALAYHYTGESDGLLNKAWVFSPYVKGKVGPATIELAYTYAGNGDEQVGAAEGFGFSDSAHAAFARVSAKFGVVGVEGQVAATRDGGLMSAGFDSFSTLISNNPTQNRNPVSVASMGGGLGTADFDETLFAGRLSFSPIAKVKLTLAAGNFERETATIDKLDTTFVDLQAHYEIAPATTAWVSYGQASGDEEDGIFTDDVKAATVNLRTVF